MKYVSIVLPTYNRAYCIKRAIDSILHQTYPYWELLVVDDASTDGTEEIVAGIAALDERVHYVRLPCNKGVAAARNEGIRQAQHEYIAFQDSDDIWKEEKLEKQMRTFEKQPEAGMVYCAYEGTKQDGTVVRIPSEMMVTENLRGKIYRQILLQNMIGAPTVVIRRACFHTSGIFDETLTCLEDWELFLRIAKEYPVGYVNEALLISDIREGGVSSRAGGYFYARCKMIVDHKKELMEYGMFNQVTEQMLMMAGQAGVLQQAAQMLQSMLAG